MASMTMLAPAKAAFRKNVKVHRLGAREESISRLQSARIMRDARWLLGPRGHFLFRFVSTELGAFSPQRHLERLYTSRPCLRYTKVYLVTTQPFVEYNSYTNVVGKRNGQWTSFRPFMNVLHCREE
jgi:hypothetical protein